jgi:Putative adhesin
MADECAANGAGGIMARRRSFAAAAAAGWLALGLLSASCRGGPPATGSFERTFNISGPVRLELNNAAGDVTIRGGADGSVHIHGDVRVSGIGFGNAQQRLNEIVSNPPLEQKGDTVRIGKDLARMHNLSIAYVIEVPQSTEISTKLASGAQNISGIRGPVQADAASGAIRANNIDRAVHLATASGAVEAENCGDELRVSTASGSVTADNVKGDVLINAMSGSIQVAKPGARVEARAASGSIEVRGANNDVKARAASGRIAVQGNPSGNSYWDLKTASGAVEISVPSNANFHLSAAAKTGGIRTDIPIVIEEQSKRSLRAHMGDGGGRVEIQTASGTIRVRGPE